MTIADKLLERYTVKLLTNNLRITRDPVLLIKLCDRISTSVDQDWDNETTIYKFDDFSAIAISSNADVQVLGQVNSRD